MRKIIIIQFFLLVTLTGCEDFLDERPDKSLVVPTTIENLQALLDNSTNVMNQDPAIGLIGSDDLHTTESGWSSYSNQTERNAYLWQKEIFEGFGGDWNLPYVQIFYANVVLEQASKIKPAGVIKTEAFNNVKGSALFYRAYAFFNLSQLFAGQYVEDTANEKLGIPLRITSSVNDLPARATLKETYDRIINDLEESLNFLPRKPQYLSRPSLAAANALLARVYLAMEDYQNAGLYADRALQIQNTFLDFNDLNPSLARPVPRFNEEVIFHSRLVSYSFTTSPMTLVNDEVYQSFEPDDLRKDIFFTTNSSGNINFKGSYSGDNRLFSGLAVDEMFLIRAESRARTGDISGAINDLNTLLEKRWKEGNFEPLDPNNPAEVLDLILKERRKELLFRGLRWTDLRRLNMDPKYAITLTRDLGGVIYTLPPNDLRYVYPIPPEEIEQNRIQQNPR